MTCFARLSAGLVAIAWAVAFLTACAPGIFAAETGDDYDPGRDGPDPGLAMFALLAVAIMFVLIGAGVVVGAVVLVILAVLLGVGVVSFSVAFGFLKKRPSSAFRALFLQAGAIAGLPCGIAALWFATWLFHIEVAPVWVGLLGGLAGIAAGLAAAAAFNFAWTRAIEWARKRFGRKPDNVLEGQAREVPDKELGDKP